MRATTDGGNDAATTDGANDAATVDSGTDFGKPCGSGTDCASGLCVEARDGTKVCTTTCTSDCPTTDWRCGPSTIDAGTNVCWPRFDFVCRPCEADSDCRFTQQGQSTGDTSTCVKSTQTVGNVSTTEGSFCGATCDNAHPCPNDYDCRSIAASDGGTVKTCVKAVGACECDASWVGRGYKTTCEVTVASVGTCTATRVCSSAGPLAACPAATPATEVCNGVDDNCNQQIDEGGDALCADDGLSCTVEQCTGVSGCKSQLAPNKCLISGACYDQDAKSAVNPCAQCKPLYDPIAFTIVGNSCAIGNQCVPAGTVNPGNACLICDPARSTTNWVDKLDTCVIGGTCYAAGASAPSMSCQICNPQVRAAKRISR